MIALLISGAAMGALFQGTLGGIAAAERAGRTEEALSHARSRLAAVGHAAPLQPEDREGEDGLYRWRVRVAPLATGVAATGGRPPVLFGVEVTVGWSDGRQPGSVTLRSRRLGQAPAAAPP